MLAKEPLTILQDKTRAIRQLIINVTSKQKYNSTITLLTQKEITSGEAIVKLFSLNTFLGCASGNTSINTRVYQALTQMLEGKLTLEVFKSTLAQLKKEDREGIKNPAIGWAWGTGLFALIIGISALALYFFNPTEWLYPYGWMAIYEIAGAIIAPLFLAASAYIFKICYDYKETRLKTCWEGISGNGIQSIIDTLTSEDVTLFQKLNSVDWQKALNPSNQTHDLNTKDDQSQQFNSPLNATPPPSSSNQGSNSNPVLQLF